MRLSCRTGRGVRGAIIVFLVLSASAGIFAAPPAKALDSVLDPAMGLKEISDAVAAGKPVAADRFYIMTGRLGVVVDLTDEAEGSEFLGESELVGGEWIGLESVRSFRAYLRFRGNRFAGMADDESTERIKKGSLVVIIASYLGKKKEYGTSNMVAEMDVWRIIPVE